MHRFTFALTLTLRFLAAVGPRSLPEGVAVSVTYEWDAGKSSAVRISTPSP